LKQAVCDCVPIAENLVIAGDAEIKRVAQPAQCRELIDTGGLTWVRGEVEGYSGFQCAKHIAELIQIRTKVGVSLRANRALLWHGLRSCAQDVGRKNIKLRRIIDAFERVLSEQAVAPGNQVIQISH